MLTRRRFLKNLLGAFLALTGISFVGTIVAYLSPRKQKGGRKILLDPNGSPIPIKELEDKSYLVGVGIDGEPTIVIRYEGKLRALSAVCTHLGCLVKWFPNRAEFFCPCHAGRFDANGVNIAGPPPSPLKRFRSFATKEGYIGLEEVTS